MTTPSPATTLDLEFNEDQCAIADAVNAFCKDQLDKSSLKPLAPSFDRSLWRARAELGVFTPATPLGEGGALEICAIAEVLGQHVFPGPVTATVLAMQALPDDARQSIACGNSLVSLSQKDDTLLPWGMDADIFLATDGHEVYRAEIPVSRKPVQTLGGEPWGRASLRLHNEAVADSARALLLGRVCTAAYQCGAALQLVRETSDYANIRKQFGKTLGEFQAVAHPLADCQIRLTAARYLARAAACCFDRQEPDDALRYSHAAVLSANCAAVHTAHTCHQIYAAIGVTLEGPAFLYSRRIRQVASQAPTENHSRHYLLNTSGLQTAE